MAKSVDKVNLPDGSYTGYQEVYNGVIEQDGKTISFETNVGLKCGKCKIPMNWQVKDGYALGKEAPRGKKEPLNESRWVNLNTKFSLREIASVPDKPNTSHAVLLRKLAPKSTLGIGKYGNVPIQQLIDLNHTEYLRWIYYNINGIDFADEIKRAIRIQPEDEIPKPGTNPEKGAMRRDELYSHAHADAKKHINKIIHRNNAARMVKSDIAVQRISNPNYLTRMNQGHLPVKEVNNFMDNGRFGMPTDNITERKLSLVKIIAEGHIPDFYKELSDSGYSDIKPEEWETCPVCHTKPKVWIYDHGEFAKCTCYETFGNGVRGKSIWDYHKEHNGDMTNYNHHNLRDNWNKRCQELKTNKPMNTKPTNPMNEMVNPQNPPYSAKSIDEVMAIVYDFGRRNQQQLGALATRLESAMSSIKQTMPAQNKPAQPQQSQQPQQGQQQTNNPLQVQETPKDNSMFKAKPMWGKKLSLTELVTEKWDKNVKIDNTGENTDKTISQLKNEKEGADTKTKQQKNFAIRAKEGWPKGKIKEDNMNGHDVPPAPDTMSEDVVGAVDQGLYAGGANPSQAFTAKKADQGMPVMEVSTGLAQKAYTIARGKVSASADADPIGAFRTQKQASKFGEYINPELKNWLASKGIWSQAQKNSIRIGFSDKSNNGNVEIVVNPTTYKLSSGSLGDIPDKYVNMLRSIIARVQADLTKSINTDTQQPMMETETTPHQLSHIQQIKDPAHRFKAYNKFTTHQDAANEKNNQASKKYRMTEAQLKLMKELVVLQEQTNKLNGKKLLF